MNVGHVYVVHTSLARPPKDKLTVCISVSENLFFWINTQPAHHGLGQLPLEARDHSALTHDCYLDCSRITMFSAAELTTARHRGPLSRALVERIVDLLRHNPPRTLPPRLLRVAIDNLAATMT